MRARHADNLNEEIYMICLTIKMYFIVWHRAGAGAGPGPCAACQVDCVCYLLAY